ncbi:MAG: hypothetical protein LBI27_09385 [Clostridiales bacterium]|nr:hypothetical protein [Clostridiales bacterium]
MVLVTRISVSFESDDVLTIPLYVVGIASIGIGIYIWIRRRIWVHYLKRQEIRAIQILERELAEQKEENQRLIKQNDILRAADHKIKHRLTTLERVVSEAIDLIDSQELKDKLAEALEDIKRTEKDYKDSICKLVGHYALPSTKINMLDELFKNFADKFAANKIDFKLNVNGSIPYLVEKIIDQAKLETMIGDHLENALIAVNASENSFRSVWAILGLTEDCYEFTVHDSGIPFAPDTLAQLGTKQITTHAENGGSGIGFMTTFATLRKCNASLIIEEKQPNKPDFTKSVTIRFDGKEEYVINETAAQLNPQ